MLTQLVCLIRRNVSFLYENWNKFLEPESADRSRLCYYLSSIAIFCQPILLNFEVSTSNWITARSLAKFLIQTANAIRMKWDHLLNSQTKLKQSEDAINAFFSNVVWESSQARNKKRSRCFEDFVRRDFVTSSKTACSTTCVDNFDEIEEEIMASYFDSAPPSGGFRCQITVPTDEFSSQHSSISEEEDTCAFESVLKRELRKSQL